MQTLHRIRRTLALAMIGFGVLCPAAHATETASGNTVIIPQNRIVEDDLAIAGSNVEVQAHVTGNVMAAGSNVRISGPVDDSLMSAGANITISAPISRNAMAAGSEVVFLPTASVGRDAHLVGATVQVQGPVKHNLIIGASDATLSSDVGGFVEAHVERLTLQPGAVIHGDLVVYAPTPPQISPEARVLGRIDYHKTENSQQKTGPGNGMGWWLFRFLSLLLLGTAVVLLFPIWVERVTKTMVEQTGRSVLVGLLGLPLVPLFSLFAMLTLIGIPIGLLLLALYSISLLLTGVFVSSLIGGWLLRRFGRPNAAPMAQFALGAFLVSVLSALPWIGGPVECAILIVGFGAWVLERRDLFLRLRTEGLA